jgi:Zn finger protein HypA/HybF involved in hydrogenase expression
MIAMGIVGAIAAVLLVMNFRMTRKERDFVYADRSSICYAPIQIICGDCAGDGVSPIKTLLTQRGRCDACGGKSYTLASQRGAYMEVVRLLKLHDPFLLEAVASTQGETFEGNVVPFDPARADVARRMAC